MVRKSESEQSPYPTGQQTWKSPWLYQPNMPLRGLNSWDRLWKRTLRIDAHLSRDSQSIHHNRPSCRISKMLQLHTPPPMYIIANPSLDSLAVSKGSGCSHGTELWRSSPVLANWCLQHASNGTGGSPNRRQHAVEARWVSVALVDFCQCVQVPNRQMKLCAWEKMQQVQVPLF